MPVTTNDPAGARTILLAAPRSFCAGVDRAIAIVEQLLEARRFAGTPWRLRDPDRQKMVDVVPAADGDSRPADRGPRELALRKPQGLLDVPTDLAVRVNC